MKLSERAGKDAVKKNTAGAVINDLRKYADPKRAAASKWFFKTGRGEYGEGDIFWGVSVPQIRMTAKKFQYLSLRESERLLESKIHEHRLASLFILVDQFKRAAEPERKKIFEFYLSHAARINNWDLVDSSAHKIVGAYLFDKDRKILAELARSRILWERRIAIVSTFYFIGKGESLGTLRLAKALQDDKEDLMHKAVGWALREVGKRCGTDVEEKFLRENYRKMPRTTLRYAIERFPEPRRQAYLKGKI